MSFDPQRFLSAHEAVHEVAVAELRAGRKRSHWMWFVFPQIAGLGRSEMSRLYALESLDAARAYAQHPVLGARLREAAGAVLQTVDGGATDAESIFGSIDAIKLRSSMTLFARAVPDESRFRAVLERLYGGEEDPATLKVLEMAEAPDTTDPVPAPGKPPPASTPERSFGEEGARLTYGSYLRIEELLDQQRLESEPPAHDELLFITIHQVYELWFKLMLHELDATRLAMTEGRLWLARHLLRRVLSIENVLVAQLAVLETMTPQDFLQFREKLAPASGFQSVQFRELEFLSGAKDPAFLRRFHGLTDGERGRLERRLEEPSLWDAFLAALRARGLPTHDDQAVLQSLLTVSRDRVAHAELWELAEALLDHDEAAVIWRSRHVLMVERQIGTKSGTGGSSGSPYLRGRIELRYFPLLWELRSWL